MTQTSDCAASTCNPQSQPISGALGTGGDSCGNFVAVLCAGVLAILSAFRSSVRGDMKRYFLSYLDA